MDVLIICRVHPEAHRNQVIVGEAEGLGDIRPSQATLTPCVSHGADEGYFGDWFQWEPEVLIILPAGGSFHSDVWLGLGLGHGPPTGLLVEDVVV